MLADSPLLRIPPEVRILIYRLLLDAGTDEIINIGHLPRDKASKMDIKKRKRSKYHTVEHSFACTAYETTYYMTNGNELHTAILGVNRILREEATHFLYGGKTFDFGDNLGAIIPFLNDRTSSTCDLIRQISIHRRASTGIDGFTTYNWGIVCEYLGRLSHLRKLRLVLEGGLPRQQWDGPQVLSVSDLRLLYATRHEAMEWVRDLSQLGTVVQVELVAEMQSVPTPTTSKGLVLAALSGSIKTSLIEFLRSDLRIATTCS